MSESAIIGHGTLFKIDGVAVAELDSINPRISSEDIESTDMDSPEKWREYIKGMRDGEVNFDVHFRPGHHGVGGVADIMQYITDDDVKTMRIEWVDGTNWEFEGRIHDCDVTATAAGKVDATFRVRITGVVSFNAA